MPLTKDQIRMAYAARPFLSMGLWEDGTAFVNFNLDPTLRCDGGCPDCMKFLGHLPMTSHESDFTREHVELVAKILSDEEIVAGTFAEVGESGVKRILMRRLRVTGGEPLLHPDFMGLYKSVCELWEPIAVRVYTNGRHPLPWGGKRIGSVMRPKSMSQKREQHVPFYASPADLGIEPINGFDRPCCIINGCGRSIDAYGFSPCLQYPALGRLIGRDLHYGRPKLLGDEEVCRDCICSLSKQQQRRVRRLIVDGRIEYPTRFYREGFARERDDPQRFAGFAERVERREDVEVPA